MNKFWPLGSTVPWQDVPWLAGVWHRALLPKVLALWGSLANSKDQLTKRKAGADRPLPNFSLSTLDLLMSFREGAESTCTLLYIPWDRGVGTRLGQEHTSRSTLLERLSFIWHVPESLLKDGIRKRPCGCLPGPRSLCQIVSYLLPWVPCSPVPLWC